jgi:PAS domain-containing protein
LKSKLNLTEQDSLYGVLLDAIPSPIFVVEEDVRILGFNEAAAAMASRDPTHVLQQRGGEVLHCVHATETEEGCGHSPACRDCVVRNSVNVALLGQTTNRQRARMKLLVGGESTDAYLLVTSVPFDFRGRKLVLLILEDISELMDLRRLIPICASCKKIRDDRQYWQQVDQYFTAHWDVLFTHSLCPDCVKKYFPDE